MSEMKFYNNLEDKNKNSKRPKFFKKFKRFWNSPNMQTKVRPELVRTMAVLFFTFVYGIGLSWFLQGSSIRLYTGGVPGLGQLLIDFLRNICKVEITKNFESTFLAIFLAVCNIPLLILGWFGVSKRFFAYSLVSIVIQSTLIGYMGVDWFSAEDPLVLALIGGILTGVGVGGTLRFGASSGGLDIIGQYLVLKKSKMSVGRFSTAINILIILVGSIFMLFGDGADVMTKIPMLNSDGVYELTNIIVKYPPAQIAAKVAIYTIIRLLIGMIVMDKIHTAYNYLEANIVTNLEQELVLPLLTKLHHGVTIIDVRGGYHYEEKTMLLITIYAFEQQKLMEIVNELDPNAFIIFKSVKTIKGKFFTKTVA